MPTVNNLTRVLHISVAITDNINTTEFLHCGLHSKIVLSDISDDARDCLF